MKKLKRVYLSDISDRVLNIPATDPDWNEIIGILAKTKPGCKMTIPIALYDRILSRTPSASRTEKPLSQKLTGKTPKEILQDTDSSPEFLKSEICPMCSGDGGVNGGCYKCDGTGWVTFQQKHSCQPPDVSGWGDNSRVSNYDYLGLNQGAHFREKDGRIGSNPEHDDYSDESNA
jgi:hypothetical protein